MEDVQDLTEIEMPHHLEERGEEKGAEPPGERQLNTCSYLCDSYLHLVFRSSGEKTSPCQSERPSTPSHLTTTVV